MAPAAPATRKRVRKRKRRQVSSSEESSSSSDSSDSDSGTSPKKIAAVTATAVKQPTPSSSSSSSSSESDESDLEVSATKATSESVGAAKKLPSRSPSPVSADIPPFPSSDEHLKDRFRQFWLGSVADAFKDDLEQIRKEPNLTTSKLAVLIDSLGAGAEVFASSSDVDEMQLVLEPST